MTWNDWFSIIAVLISVIALGWNIYRDVLDTGKLNVSIVFGDLVVDGEVQGKQAVLAITNVGRRPLIIRNIGGKDKTGQPFFLLPRTLLHKALNEGEIVQEIINNWDQYSDITELTVWDTKGKKHKANKRELKLFNKSVKKALN